MLAGECHLQQGLHWAEDHVLVEVIHPDTLEPCPPGEEGVLVLTDLTRENMPLLRYWTGDIASLVTDPCPCGRTHARSVGGVRGRIDGLIMYRGVKFYPFQVERLLISYGLVSDSHRIVLERDPVTWLDRCTVFVEANPGDWAVAELQERLAQRLRDELGAELRVKVLPYGSLPRSPRKQLQIEDRRWSP